MIARLAAGLVLAAACVVTEPMAQQASPPNGPVAAMQDAAMQDYALRLRDAEARLRAAHERLAAGSSPASRTPSDPPARQQLVDAARDAWTVVRSAPGDMAGSAPQAEADRRFREGLDRLGQADGGGVSEADTARAMLQALSALREAAGAPPAPPATGGTTPTEPAASGGGQS
jgi:hypothetical protein